MCGIVGYVGDEQAVPLLLNGLKRLEYRGYDSSGVAVINKNRLVVKKSKGRLQVLDDLLDHGNNLEGNIGIGHTRWATHGEPSDVNSHPQTSKSGKFAVVHNGIIENYPHLKDSLISKGYPFVSDTDTEVIAQLLEYCYNGDLLDTVIKVQGLLKGSYAVGIICEDYPDEIICIKKDNPLILGLSNCGNFITSDIIAIASRTKNFIRLKDDEIAILKKDEVSIYDNCKNKLEPEISVVNWEVKESEKGEFAHFMLKEMREQPKVIKNILVSLNDIHLTKDYLERIDKIFIVGCGSAYHVGCIAKYVFEKMIRKPVEVDIASEFRYRNPILTKNTLVIAISQSGETADTLAAVRESKRLGAHVISIVNVFGSSIANESDDVIYTLAGPEIAVATTKGYSSQLTVIYILAMYMAYKLGKIDYSEYAKYREALDEISLKIEYILDHDVILKQFACKFKDLQNVFFIGRNLDYALALEGSLKFKEISYIHSEAYPAGELKHGTISLIEEGTLVVAIATQDELIEKMISNIKEVKARGARILAIANEGNKEIDDISDYIYTIPKTLDIFRPILGLIPLQLLAYHFAVARGCDIDKPRNLAKSVTVE
jgi:glucosamine--fructose-6-phosphate aminotransferase (isomerizing)